MTEKHRPIAAVEPHSAPAIDTQTGTVLSLIERAARDPSIDIGRMQQLMEMHETVTQREAERRFNAAMSAAQAEMPRVMRNATNTHNASRYATLDAVHRAITPIVTKHGFSLSFDTEPGAPAGFVRLACTVAHRDGFSRVHRADLPSDAAGSQGKANKTGIQAFGSTVSYGRRYLTLLVFNIALTNDRDDNDGQPISQAEPELISDAQVCELLALIKATDTRLESFLELGQVSSLEDISTDQFENAKRMLSRKLHQQRQGAANV